MVSLIEKLGIPEEEKTPHITYKEFLALDTVEPGTVVTEVKPRDLFTYQDWVMDDKIINVLRYASEEDPRLFNISGYIHYHSKFENNVLVVGNGQHRALYALSLGQKVNIKIQDPLLDKKENPFRLINIEKKYGNVFRGL